MLTLDQQNEWRERYRRANLGWQPATELFAATVRQHLRRDGRVLDLGCGRGGLVEQLDHPLEQMMGVDPDWASLQTHRLDMPRVAGLGQLPFAKQQFDVVYASWVLEHWQNPIQDLSEIGRVLKPNGAFVFITPNKRHPLIKLNRILSLATATQRELVAKLYGRAGADTFPAYYRANSPLALDSLATSCGLELAQLNVVADPTYLAFSERLFGVVNWLDGLVSAESQLHLVGTMTPRT